MLPFGFHASKKTLLQLVYGGVDDALVDSFSTVAMRHAVRWYVADGLPQFSDKSFYIGLTIYVPTSVQNFIELSGHWAMLW